MDIGSRKSHEVILKGPQHNPNHIKSFDLPEVNHSYNVIRYSLLLFQSVP